MFQDMLKLYRGDFSKIEDFDYKKTHKDCLFGQGVYLTNSLEVANSYRSKVDYRRRVDFDKIRRPIVTLYEREAANRNVAYENAFMDFCKEVYWVDYLERPFNRFEFAAWYDKPKNLQAPRRVYQDLIADKIITAEYFQSYRYIKVPKTRTNPHGEAREQYKGIRIEYRRQKGITGFLTHFSFPRKEFLDSMIFIDTKRIQNDQVYDILRQEYPRIFTHEYGTYRDDEIIDLGKGHFEAIQRICKPYGYRGFEYTGGGRIGGYGNHRCFVVWDDDFVNRHIVSQVQ